MKSKGAQKTRKFRSAPRKDLIPVLVSSISSLETLSKIAREAEIVQASSSGFLVLLKRENLVPLNLRRNLSLEALLGSKVILQLPQMNLQVSGTIVRTQLVGKTGYELAIDYSEDAPDYWRECLFDLLPAPGELD